MLEIYEQKLEFQAQAIIRQANVKEYWKEAKLHIFQLKMQLAAIKKPKH